MRHRGKLDVPKERFISYPFASPDADPSLLLGWAGWDHREQAAALITLIEDRSTTDGWDTGKERLAHGWSLREFSARTGIDFTTASRIENGKRPPNEAVAKACDLV